MRPVPRRRRQRRRDGPVHRPAPPHPRRPAAGGADPRGHSGCAACRRARSPMPRWPRSSASCARSSASPRPRRRRGRSRRAGGGTIDGVVLGEGFDDLQVRTADGRVRLLRREGDRVREVTSETGWPTYNGDPGGNRHTTLTQIDKTNVARLAPAWMFTVPNAGGLQGTPLVVDGMMYVTAPNEMLRARRRERTADLAFPAPAHQGRRPGTREPRRRRRRRSRLPGDRRCAGDCAEPVDRHAAVGRAARRLAAELLGHVGAVDRRQSRDLRRHGRRARRQRIRRRARSGDRQGGLAVLDGAEARRARIGNVEGDRSRRSSRRGDLVHRQLRSRARSRLLARRQSEPGVQRRRSRRATISTRTPLSRSTARRAG